ncbi:MAG: hypothetical protein V3R98_11745 [Alphaproteobacteria bacterium]
MPPLLPTGTGRGGRRPAGQRGVALIAVLWTVALLSLMAMAFLAETRSHANLTRNLLENAKAEALADAGVYRAVAGLLDADFITGWRADGTVYTLAMGEGEVRITIADEGGKIDLNRAPDALLAGLFGALGVPEGEAAPLVDAIADFRDGDALRRAAGAEDADYAAAGRAWGAKDAPFESVAELQQVLGIDRALRHRPFRPRPSQPGGGGAAGAAGHAAAHRGPGRRAAAAARRSQRRVAAPDRHRVHDPRRGGDHRRRPVRPRGPDPAHRRPQRSLSHPRMAPNLGQRCGRGRGRRGLTARLDRARTAGGAAGRPPPPE